MWRLRKTKMKNQLQKIGMTALIILAVLVVNGCKKKTGCTDSSATNFDGSAQKDDGSCTYKGNVVFWNDVASSLGIVTVVMADNTSGNITVDETSAPSCNASGCFTYTNKPGTYSFAAAELSPGTHTWSGSVTITSKGCSSYRLY